MTAAERLDLVASCWVRARYGDPDQLPGATVAAAVVEARRFLEDYDRAASKPYPDGKGCAL